MTSVLITDADIGVGAELVRQYAADGWQVYAACSGRGADVSGANIVKLDYDASTEDAALRLAAAIGDAPLDVVIAHSAVTPGNDTHVAGIVPADWVATVTAAAYAPAKIAYALRPHLEKGGLKKLVALSSFAASIGGNTAALPYSFRAAKAALNSLWRSFSVECRPLGITCLLLVPDDEPARSLTETATALRQTIAGAGMDKSGEVFNAKGAHIPW